MVKRPYFLALCTLLGPASVASAYAQDAYLPQPPDMPAYMAYEVRPSIHQRIQSNLSFLEGWYITSGVNISFMGLTGIENDQSVFANATTAKSSTSQTRVGPAAAIGYEIRPNGGILSRAEIAYYYRSNFQYNANPFLITDPPQPADANFINSDIDNNTVLLKVYDDFNFGSPFVPYIQVGAGVAINSISANSIVGDISSGTQDEPFVTDSDNHTKVYFAADAGLGARIELNPNFLLDVGYEFEYLGNNLKYNLNYTNPLIPGFMQQVKLTTGIFYSNSILVGITWRPIPKESTT